jgi:hypothetical protein
MVVGVWILRRRRAHAGLPPSIYQARNTTVLLFLLCAIFLLIMPWYAIIVIPSVVILISYMTGYPQSLVTRM